MANESHLGNSTLSRTLNDSAIVHISLYTLIFVLATTGNCLVLLTLAQNKRMRTVTNVFLLNLAVSDLLLAIFCMPFTLIPILLRNFVFGATMCVVIRYLQSVCVGVSCFTLVAISLERYFAICRPLRSRSWQTRSHSYKTIAVCWLLAGVLMTPTAAFQKLVGLKNGAHKCIELWTDEVGETAYTIIIDVLLLLLPIIIMACAYGSIIFTLQQDGPRLTAENDSDYCKEHIPLTPIGSRQRPTTPKRTRDYTREMRQSNAARSTASKKRVILVLFVIVIEFFVCWTPLYVINTWRFFHRKSAVYHISPTLQSLVYLLSYISSCCNPITYCFLHKNFRQGFLAVCRCPWLSAKRLSRKSQYSFSAHSLRTNTVRVSLDDGVEDSDYWPQQRSL